MTITFARQNQGTGHSYTMDGQAVPGVTTVLNQLAKPALTQWAARMAADYVSDNWDRLQTMTPSERNAAVKGAPNQRKNAAAVRGSRVHALGQMLANGQQVEVPDDLASPVKAYARFLDRWQIETVATELPVGHTLYRYGGTVDLLFSTPKLWDGMVLLGDVKTGRGVYRETSLQLGGYSLCNVALERVDYTGPRGGRKHRYVQVDLRGYLDDDQDDFPEEAFVLHVGEDDVELLPVDISGTTREAFLDVLAVHRWVEWCETAKPVGRAITPETVAADQ